MTDREVLLLAYGALKGVENKCGGLDKMLFEIIEGHLFPQPIILPATFELEPKGPARE